MFCANVAMQIACDDTCTIVNCRNKGFRENTKWRLFSVIPHATKGNIVIANRGFKQGEFVLEYTGNIVPSFKPSVDTWNWYIFSSTIEINNMLELPNIIYYTII